MAQYESGSFAARAASGNQQNNQAFQTTGALIMQVAELLRPRLLAYLEGAEDEHGMPLQPARVRGMALIIAQEMVKAGKAKPESNA